MNKNKDENKRMRKKTEYFFTISFSCLLHLLFIDSQTKKKKKKIKRTKKTTKQNKKKKKER